MEINKEVFEKVRGVDLSVLPKKEDAKTLQLMEKIIDLLEKEGPLTAKEIAEKLGEKKESLYVVLGKLTRAGILKKDKAKEIKDLLGEPAWKYTAKEQVWYIGDIPEDERYKDANIIL